MKRKKIEAWGEVLNGELSAVHCDRKVVETWAWGDKYLEVPIRVARLVEYSPAEAAVLRAADRLATNGTEWKPKWDAFCWAVDRLRRERERKRKRTP